MLTVCGMWGNKKCVVPCWQSAKKFIFTNKPKNWSDENKRCVSVWGQSSYATSPWRSTDSCVNIRV